MGCGRSDKPKDDRYDYTLQSRIEDLGTLIDSLDFDEPITVIVHDWGGMIGTCWAGANADRVARMVAMNTFAFHRPDGKAFPKSIALARVPGLGGALVRGFSAFSRGANRYCMTRTTMSDEVKQGYLEPYDSWDNRIAVHRFVQDIPLKSTDPAYAVVTRTQEGLANLKGKPMFFPWGMKDFVFDHLFLEKWIEFFPDAEVMRIPDAGHYVLEDARSEVVPAIVDFVTRGGGAAAVPTDNTSARTEAAATA